MKFLLPLLLICELAFSTLAFAIPQPRLKKKSQTKSTHSYACTEADCSKVYTARKSLRTHINSVHRGTRFTCTFPGCTQKPYKNLLTLYKHKKSSHEGNRIVCSLCANPPLYKSQTGYQSHLKKNHPDQKSSCEKIAVDQTESDDDAILMAYVTTELAAIERHPQCKKCFPNFESNRGQENICEKRLQSNLDLKRYIYADHQQKRYLCTYTGCTHAPFKHYNTLSRHIKATHQGFRFICLHCLTPFPYKSYGTLQDHTKKHHPAEKMNYTYIIRDINETCSADETKNKENSILVDDTFQYSNIFEIENLSTVDGHDFDFDFDWSHEDWSSGEKFDL